LPLLSNTIEVTFGLKSSPPAVSIASSLKASLPLPALVTVNFRTWLVAEGEAATSPGSADMTVTSSNSSTFKVTVLS
jgi:hypothetical protein